MQSYVERSGQCPLYSPYTFYHQVPTHYSSPLSLMFFHQFAFLTTHHMKKSIFVVAFLQQTFFLTFLVLQCRIPYSSPITHSIIPSISWYKYYHFPNLVSCMTLLKVEKFFLIWDLGETSKLGLTHCRISKVGRLLHKQFTARGCHDLLRWGVGNNGVLFVKSSYEKLLVKESVFPHLSTRIPWVSRNLYLLPR